MELWGSLLRLSLDLNKVNYIYLSRSFSFYLFLLYYIHIFSSVDSLAGEISIKQHISSFTFLVSISYLINIFELTFVSSPMD